MFTAINAQNSDSLLNMYQAYVDKGQNEQAIKVLRKLVKYWLDVDPLLASQYAAMENQLAKQIGDSILVGQSLNDIGMSYLMQKTYFMATESFFKAYDIFQRYGDKKNLGYTLLNIGKAYLEQGIGDIAETKFKLAKETFEQIGDKYGIALSLQYLGLANLKSDEQHAVKYLQQAIALLIQLNDQHSLAQTKLILSKAFYEIGENDSSITYSRQALQYFETTHSQIEIAKCYLLLAKNYYDLGNYHSSYSYGLRALRIFQNLKINEKIADVYLLFAKIHWEKGRLDSVISNALKSASIAETYGYLEILSNDYDLLASSYAKKKDYPLAYQYKTLYSQTLTRLFENVKQQHFSSFQMNLETENKEKQIELLKMQSEKENLRKDKELYRRTAMFTTIIIFLILVFGVILILRYREKVKTSQLLESTNDQLVKEIEIRKKTEQKFRDSEERYRLLFRKTPMGIFQFDENLIITDVNDRFAEILHLHRDDIINQPLDKFLDRNLVRVMKDTLDKDLEISDEQVEILTRQGIAYVKISLKPFQYIKDDKPIKSAIAIVQDITEHKKTEQLYKINASRKHKLLEMLPDSLILVNPGGQILEAHLPHSPEMEFGAKHINDIVSPKTAALFLNELDLTMKQKKSRKFLFTNSKGNKLLARIIPDIKTDNALIIITLMPELVGENGQKTVMTGLDFRRKDSKSTVIKDIENEIENELIPMYQNLQRALSFVMIKSFIERIEAVGDKFNLIDMKTYASKLQAALEEFDVMRVTDLLSQFPALINKYIGYETFSF